MKLARTFRREPKMLLTRPTNGLKIQRRKLKSKPTSLEIRQMNSAKTSNRVLRMPRNRLRSKLKKSEIRQNSSPRRQKILLKRLLIRPTSGPRMPRKKSRNKLILLETKPTSLERTSKKAP